MQNAKEVHYEIWVYEGLDGRMIKSILQSELKFSRRLLRNLTMKQSVLKNGKAVHLTERVQIGDVLQIILPGEDTDLKPEPMNLDILYEDQEVLVVNKPADMLMHPTSRERTGSLLAGVADHLAALHLVPHSVHRLDRDTSGAVMLAKHAHTHHLFDIALRNGEMHRTYCALVWADPFADDDGQSADWDVIDLPIAQDPARPSRRIISASGARAITHYRVVAHAGPLNLVQVVLETGRTHQIRLHFSAIGMPLVGDPAYGVKNALQLESKCPPCANLRRQALHALELSWKHPVYREWHHVQAEIPRDLLSLWSDVGGEEVAWDKLVPDYTPLQ